MKHARSLNSAAITDALQEFTCNRIVPLLPVKTCKNIKT